MRFSDTSDYKPKALYELVLLATGNEETARLAKLDQIQRQLFRRAGIE